MRRNSPAWDDHWSREEVLFHEQCERERQEADAAMDARDEAEQAAFDAKLDEEPERTSWCRRCRTPLPDGDKLCSSCAW